MVPQRDARLDHTVHHLLVHHRRQRGFDELEQLAHHRQRSRRRVADAYASRRRHTRTVRDGVDETREAERQIQRDVRDLVQLQIQVRFRLQGGRVLRETAVSESQHFEEPLIGDELLQTAFYG